MNTQTTPAAVHITRRPLWEMIDNGDEMVRLVRQNTEFGAIGRPSRRLAW